LGSEAACGLLQLFDHALVQRGEPALLGWGEVVGDREGVQILQRVSDGVQARLELSGALGSSR